MVSFGMPLASSVNLVCRLELNDDRSSFQGFSHRDMQDAGVPDPE
jgi:hypothetical protein